MTDEQCSARTAPRPLGVPHYSRANYSGRCTRRATYTDGKAFFCTQHAKEPPTVMRKASGKIRSGLKRIESLTAQPLPERVDLEALVERHMQDAWDDWTADTGCFPGDFKITRGPKLWFTAGPWSRNVATALAAELRALRLPGGGGEGWVMVPREPVREMWAAGADAVVRYGERIGVHHDKITEAIWSAMLSAAPSPPKDPA